MCEEGASKFVKRSCQGRRSLTLLACICTLPHYSYYKRASEITRQNVLSVTPPLCMLCFLPLCRVIPLSSLYPFHIPASCFAFMPLLLLSRPKTSWVCIILIQASKAKFPFLHHSPSISATLKRPFPQFRDMIPSGQERKGRDSFLFPFCDRIAGWHGRAQFQFPLLQYSSSSYCGKSKQKLFNFAECPFEFCYSAYSGKAPSSLSLCEWQSLVVGYGCCCDVVVRLRRFVGMRQEREKSTVIPD